MMLLRINSNILSFNRWFKVNIIIWIFKPCLVIFSNLLKVFFPSAAHHFKFFFLLYHCSFNRLWWTSLTSTAAGWILSTHCWWELVLYLCLFFIALIQRLLLLLRVHICFWAGLDSINATRILFLGIFITLSIYRISFLTANFNRVFCRWTWQLCMIFLINTFELRRWRWWVYFNN